MFHRPFTQNPSRLQRSQTHLVTTNLSCEPGTLDAPHLSHNTILNIRCYIQDQSSAFLRSKGIRPEFYKPGPIAGIKTSTK
ncbi:hypothetical protein Moror_2691 [Moniliophthora roreri MCA 2997]|uniref:Uncharacterized protein n=1 Tax=Moniliophthora roreri (strain MCA 2997) TaxID=1381753 RepID=V2XF15_MONRO|nr:hypothetical protein Moror_2691 [Moniliophthora roreri MCA 2997]